MFKENALSWAATWAPEAETRELRGGMVATSANDEDFLLPPPPAAARMMGTFGGRQRRYQVEKGKQVRVYDPIAGVFVTFSHERQLHAWLLARFDADATLLETHPKPLVYQHLGRRFKAVPHLRWKLASTGSPVLFWLRQEWTNEERERYQLFSRTHSADTVLATWAELDALAVLIDNLQLGRQVMAMVQFAGHDIRPVAGKILSHLVQHNGHCSRRDLVSELCAEDFLDGLEQVDAALFHLHALGRLRLAIVHSAFGDDTVVRCV
jgi:hypothetical protein